MFNGFFRGSKDWHFNKTSLVDNRARRVFDLAKRACEYEVYPFQLPLEGRSGPGVQVEGRTMLMLSSYDYLGLIGDPRVHEAAIAAIHKYSTGTGGVRLLTGTVDLHHQLEGQLAAFKRTAAAVTFSSGYLANLAVLSALLSPGDRVLLDSLSHRSLVDACRLSGVEVRRFQHNDPVSLRGELESVPSAGRTLIIADGVFSMDGDICRLPDLIALKKEFACYLMIDEAHAFGVLGVHGRGTDEHFGVDAREVDIWTGSLAKAIPSNGGFIAASEEVGVYLQHAAAPFIFSAALCPSAVAAVTETLSVLQAEPERLARMKRNADFLRDGLRDLGFNVGNSETPIIPVIFGDEAAAALFAGRLRKHDIVATPVLFPAVPQGSARLRICATAAHTLDDLQFALEGFRRARE